MRLLLIVALGMATVVPLSGQRMPDGILLGPVVRGEATADLLSSPPAVFAASLAIPGAGQAALGLRRWVAYVALEAALWTVRARSLSEERTASRAYRDLAWETARDAGALPRQEGSWGYYETMGQYLRSGAFDRDPGTAGVQPEVDPDSYNGTVWELARGLYLPGGVGGPDAAEYPLALEYYEARAAGPAFLWSWEGEESSLERFRSLIHEADEASRTAGSALGAVLANHLVSAVDALIVARIRSETGVRLESRVAPADPLRWSVVLRIPVPD